ALFPPSHLENYTRLISGTISPDTVHLSTKLSQVWMCPRKAECAPFDSLSQINGKWTYFPQ
ncbi:hypothetical protein PSTT_14455, partial [Puccinia striiformis]